MRYKERMGQSVEGTGDQNGTNGSSEETIKSSTRIIDLTVNQFNTLLKDVVEQATLTQATKNQLEEEDMITRKEAIKILKCAYPKLHKLMNESKITFWKDGRKTHISRASVINYIKGSK